MVLGINRNPAGPRIKGFDFKLKLGLGVDFKIANLLKYEVYVRPGNLILSARPPPQLSKPSNSN